DLATLGLLEPISMELHQGAESVTASLAALDAYRRRFESTPETLTNAILLGSLIAPLGLLKDRPRHVATDAQPVEESADGSRLAAGPAPVPLHDRRAPGPRLGELPLARRDVENLRHILGLQRRLRDLGANPRAKRALTHRHIFRDALTWMDIHGGSPEIVEHWKTLEADVTPPAD